MAMPASLLDDLATFVRTRMDAAARDKILYERNGARLNGQLLQGEINMGAAVLAWLERQRQHTASTAGAPEPADDDEADETP